MPCKYGFGQPHQYLCTSSAGEFPLSDSQALCVYLLDQAVKTAEDLGQEQIVGIFDLRDFDVSFFRNLCCFALPVSVKQTRVSFLVCVDVILLCRLC
jgi:hypothetical protein